MEQKTIEGTWEEVSRRSRELAGRRVRVTVLDDDALPRFSGDAPAGHADEEASLLLETETGAASGLAS